MLYHATTAKKCTKKRDARAKLLFCQSKPTALFRSLRRRRRRCLSSLLLTLTDTRVVFHKSGQYGFLGLKQEF